MSEFKDALPSLGLNIHWESTQGPTRICVTDESYSFLVESTLDEDGPDIDLICSSEIAPPETLFLKIAEYFRTILGALYYDDDGDLICQRYPSAWYDLNKNDFELILPRLHECDLFLKGKESHDTYWISDGQRDLCCIPSVIRNRVSLVSYPPQDCSKVITNIANHFQIATVRCGDEDYYQ